MSMIPIDYRTRHPLEDRREQLAGQVEQYLAGGHVIQSIPIGVSGEKDAVWNNRKRTPGQTDNAHAAFQRNAAEKRRLLADTVRYCAEQGMSISATADAMDLDRNTIRKIAAEHGIQFGKR
ncbi:hypothetical protein SAMN05216189_105337 [Pseudomonas delhiensis]|uniref:Transcriptional regulator SutA RNAP-binding domain-containing protein n=1 Tax=Pseudomonas delhiensis TaxID=366289 RepID=A0A239NJT6_9PSED|nr:hypothetical protein [Pseudomonas delhiensis]SDK82742.1 hypothetical protein SAMN05216189_105337 [Pseudomonas delhiensis]SNT55115.1 hypothetical protein SAMN06295949_15023 [Pseudomonas delhiensis]